jgi:hypothetical protein
MHIDDEIVILQEGEAAPALAQLLWGEVLDFGKLSDISTYIAQQKMSLLNQNAKPESHLLV